MINANKEENSTKVAPDDLAEVDGVAPESTA